MNNTKINILLGIHTKQNPKIITPTGNQENKYKRKENENENI